MKLFDIFLVSMILMNAALCLAHAGSKANLAALVLCSVSLLGRLLIRKRQS